VGYLELLRRNGGFRLLFAATLGSLLGTWLATIALTVEIKDATDSGLWVAALLVSLFLPTVVVGLTVGPLIDRLQRRRLMIFADLVRASVFCALPFAHSPAAIVALGATAGVANGFFKPAVNAGLPNLLDDADLEKGNALFQSVENVTWAAGPLVGGAIVALSGPDLAYWINAASFVFSAFLISLIPARRLQSEQALSKGHWRDLADGFALLRTAPALQVVVAAWSVVMLGSACIDVGEVFIAKDSFDAGDFGFGLLFASGGLGLAIGSIAGGMLAERRAIRTLYGPAIVITGMGYLFASGAPNIWLALPVVALAGAGNGAASLYNVLLIQRGVPDRLRGRAFTIAMSITYAVLGPAMAAAGPVTSALGGRWIWAIGGALCVVAGFVALALAPRLRTAGTISEDELQGVDPALIAHGTPAESAESRAL
jgi:MFS family permease